MNVLSSQNASIQSLRMIRFKPEEKLKIDLIFVKRVYKAQREHFAKLLRKNPTTLITLIKN